MLGGAVAVINLWYLAKDAVLGRQIIYANGRFLTRPLSGVDRVAVEVLRALAQREDAPEVRIIYPAEAKLVADPFSDLPEPARSRIVLVPFGRGNGHQWEQFVLPRYPDANRATDWLLSLCNTGPLGWPKQLVAIHDAQVHDLPTGFSWQFRLAYRVLQPLLARRARKVVTVSTHAKARLEHHKVFPSGKAKVMTLGVDHIARELPDQSVLERHHLGAGEYLLAIGSAAPHKNLQLLARLAGVPNALSRPIVVAGGVNARVFAGLPAEVTARLVMIGRVSDAELRALYENAHCFLFPSLNEGFGLPPLEAMFCGCPVIASTSSAIPEVLGDAAVLVDPTALSAWQEAVTCMDDPRHHAEYVQRGLQHSAAFTWYQTAGQLLEILTKD